MRITRTFITVLWCGGFTMAAMTLGTLDGPAFCHSPAACVEAS